jgi:5-methylcytosine-specific restriction endonuclease McrA
MPEKKGYNAQKGKEAAKCGYCGEIGFNRDIHHKDRNRLNNKPENLICICKSCHRKEHNAGSDRETDLDMVKHQTNAFFYNQRINDGFEMLQDDEVLSEIY